jgi:hypothetical protein
MFPFCHLQVKSFRIGETPFRKKAKMESNNYIYERNPMFKLREI